MLSGWVDNQMGCLRYIGIYGYDWLSLAASKIWGNTGQGAYNLYFNATGVGPSDGPGGRWVGLPLRRLAIGGGN